MPRLRIREAAANQISRNSEILVNPNAGPWRCSRGGLTREQKKNIFPRRRFEEECMVRFFEGMLRGMGWGVAASLLAIMVTFAPAMLH
jgi:hypothetical protein